MTQQIMPRKYRLLSLALLLFSAATVFLIFPQQYRVPPPRSLDTFPQATSFLILLGLTDEAATVWDGKVTVSGGWVMKIEGWRFAGNDSTDGQASWKVSTRLDTASSNMLENGVIVTGEFKVPTATVNIDTAQGSFSFAVKDIAFGTPKTFLGKKVRVEMVPRTAQLTSSSEEQDYPALAEKDDDVWVSFVEFVHGDRSLYVPSFSTEPKSFDFLARPVGGDQVKLMHYSKSRRIWTEPIAVSDPGQDVMRAAVAVDGQGRVWIFWSANRNGNFDIYARYYAQAQLSGTLRLTTDSGPDLNPVATTDLRGNVWVAWQGYRNGNLEILAAIQNGSTFSGEAIVSFSKASDWDPAIAAAPNGDIAVSWDTYDKGDYDVYFRRMRAGDPVQMDDPVPVAASETFEARSSIAFDLDGTFWVAFEGSSAKWGKDFGAYEKTGVALYQGHNIQVKCFQGSSVFATTDKLSLPQGNLNAFPRLAADSDGKVYLAFRVRTGGRASVGSIWIEYLYYFDGAKWNGPVVLPRTENLLDSRPAMLAISPGDLLVVSAMDHRLSQPSGTKGNGGNDWINCDLYCIEFQPSRSQSPLKLDTIAAEKVNPPTAEVQAEIAQIAYMRNYTTTVGGQKLQLLRGEFHRHTEISADGGGDGPLIDAYRYLIDPAYMEWGGCCDHDNGNGLEYNWWRNQKLTDAYKLGTNYIPLFAYERSVAYPEGHRNVVFVQRGIRPLPRLPVSAKNSPANPAPDTQMLYHYLKKFGGIAAAHTSATDMGTDWRDNDPILEPVVEIYQGDRQNYELPQSVAAPFTPRAITADNSIGGWEPLGFVSLALQKGYRLGFQASSDHISTHMSYCNVWVRDKSREAIMEALSKRRVFGATDNILADVRCGEHFMGEEFEVTDPPTISIKLRGMKDFAWVHIIKDGQYVYSVQPGPALGDTFWTVNLVWQDSSLVRGKTSYYYIRGEQSDGELVWVSPMWITYR